VDRFSPLSPLSLRQPAFDRLLERVLDDVLDLSGRSELLEDRLQACLRLLRRQVLGAWLGAVTGSPDDRAAGGAPP
jgi:hypothetical protein